MSSQLRALAGRLVLQEQAGSGAEDAFAPHLFEYVEDRETLAVVIEARAYEEIVIRTDTHQRTDRIATVLRRQHAEITATGDVGCRSHPAHGDAC